MDTLFTKNIIYDTIVIEPQHISNNLNQFILKKLKNKYEGQCSKYGYIKKNSIKILNRSMGKIIQTHFNGTISYNVQFSIEYYNPLEGSVFDAEILSINKMGILAGLPHEDPSPLNILLAKQHHFKNELSERFDKLQEGEIISIKVLGKRYEGGDSQISVIGVLNDID